MVVTVSVHRLTTESATTWLRPSNTAACMAATGRPLEPLGLWPTSLATSSQKTGRFTGARSWLCTSCPQMTTTASSCATKEPSRSAVVWSDTLVETSCFGKGGLADSDITPKHLLWFGVAPWLPLLFMVHAFNGAASSVVG